MTKQPSGLALTALTAITAGGVVEAAAAPREAIVHSLQANAADPDSGLLRVGREFYGTTLDGGKNNDGTVFKITAAGDFQIVHAFAGADGATPTGSLIKVGGAIYGVTSGGGAAGNGTVFKLTTSGTYSVLYSFKGGTDGQGPGAGLLAVGGTLYGVTGGGGVGSGCGGEGCGTVFSVTLGGKYKQLYTFQPTGDDGTFPNTRLLNVGGTFYGMTLNGGEYENGSIYTVTPSGKETVIHSFGESDTAPKQPYNGLIQVGDLLYGTTAYGGTADDGTAFSITKDGQTLTVLHSFGATKTDAVEPSSELLSLNGKLYGTTYVGGTADRGAVYSLTLKGRETIVYSFGDRPDALEPTGDLAPTKTGDLFGTSTVGGAHCGKVGCGTIFRVHIGG